MKMTAAGHEQFSRLITNGILRCEKSGRPFVTGFLTPAKQSAARRLCTHSAFAFAGGRINAISKRLIVFPDALALNEAIEYAALFDAVNSVPSNPGDSESASVPACHSEKGEGWENLAIKANEDSQAVDKNETPDSEIKDLLVDSPDYVAILHSSYDSSQKKLSHSDVLGALMHAGLERDAIGDIAVDQHNIFLVCLPSLSEFICQNITLIGRIPVHFDYSDAAGMPAASFVPLKINTASMRADCIVSALAHCSRSGAKDMICQGFMKVNDEVLESVKTLCNNDTISVRRVGKFRIGKLDGVSRKNRLIVHIDKYE